MTKRFNVAVFIGRMEPIHMGHVHVLKEAEKIADRVIILCGSQNRARSIKNPWRPVERETMIDLAINECIPELAGRFMIGGISDYVYSNQKWSTEVRKTVSRMMYNGINYDNGAFKPRQSVCIVGHRKDASSFYINMFPEWTPIDVSSRGAINASDLRTLYFEEPIDEFSKMARKVLPNSVHSYIRDWSGTDRFPNLKAEWDQVRTDRRMWQFAPYEVNSVTADAIVVESGNLLMIRRKGAVGRGLWAMPGGFVGSNETVLDGCMRELEEETKIDCPDRVLRGSIKKVQFYDDPSRDSRGRLLTFAHLIELPSRSEGQTKVKGSDDAAEAAWIHLGDIEAMGLRGEIFADHEDIITSMMGGM